MEKLNVLHEQTCIVSEKYYLKVVLTHTSFFFLIWPKSFVIWTFMYHKVYHTDFLKYQNPGSKHEVILLAQYEGGIKMLFFFPFYKYIYNYYTHSHKKLY